MVAVDPWLLSLVDARRRCVGSLCDRVVDADFAVVERHAGALILGHPGIISVLEVDETVATRASTLYGGRVGGEEGNTIISNTIIA